MHHLVKSIKSYPEWTSIDREFLQIFLTNLDETVYELYYVKRCFVTLSYWTTNNGKPDSVFIYNKADRNEIAKIPDNAYGFDNLGVDYNNKIQPVRLCRMENEEDMPLYVIKKQIIKHLPEFIMEQML